MLARGEIHSFGSALAREELARLMEGGASLDFGVASPLIEHLELYAREGDVETPSPPRRSPERRTGLSFAAHLCQLLMRAVSRGARSACTYWGMRS